MSDLGDRNGSFARVVGSVAWVDALGNIFDGDGNSFSDESEGVGCVFGPCVGTEEMPRRILQYGVLFL